MQILPPSPSPVVTNVNDDFDGIDILRFIIFGASVEIVSRTLQCFMKMRKTPETMLQTMLQHKSAFGLMWIVIYVTTGTAWVLMEPALHVDGLMIALTASLCTWVVFAGRYLGTFSLAVCIGFCITILLVAQSAYRWLIVALFAFLFYAFYLTFVYVWQKNETHTADSTQQTRRTKETIRLGRRRT